ncbi:hypothetical protein PCANC_05980 [Puccinia coronata f. sp. avenae]|uniref:Uncharacterized protein n=1 Tax=Puccinia coronata f. sp. avenae TaxID=200324 RepID=A0A2N5VTZ9_9BASI|nr:hypothetical protein PCANC_20234 [Puccinia coronata f. sp. avenae]PLW14659.1 hypothetical protein PCASD_18215 [Puccinia coronata f. sp. avenae]PLW53456.1 hypothetical protein PCANC_05980 [Puccinia coronata f. sp. avenae]
MATSTAQSRTILDYARRHQLTCDPEWTFDFAEEVVLQVSVPFQLVPHSESLQEEIAHTWSSLPAPDHEAGALRQFTISQLLGSLLEENWLISQGSLTYAKRFRDSVNKLKLSSQHLPLADPGWWDDGLFEPQPTYIMGDYLLQRNHAAISLQPDNLETILKEVFSFHGQQTQKELSSAVGVKPIHIPTPEELSDTAKQLSFSQYQKMKDFKLQREELFRLGSPFVNNMMANDLLEDDETHLPSEGHAISPPMVSRHAERSSAESRSRMTKEVVSAVINSLQAEEIRQFSPHLSSDTWDNIDFCLRPSLTPPSSSSSSSSSSPPSPHKTGEDTKQVWVNFLSPSADPNTWEMSSGLENPFETVLFSRTEGVPLHLDRSTSFNPRNHWDMASCLFDEPQHPHDRASRSSEPALVGVHQEENQDSLDILNQFVAGSGWDDQQFEREIFGSPGDVCNLHSRLHRIPVNVPDSPIREHAIDPELLPTCLDDCRLPGAGKGRSRKSTSIIAQGVQKVEGLRTLNIELPWNAYTFLPSTTIERLTDLDSKPVDSVTNSDDDEVSTIKDGYSFISKRLKSDHPSHSGSRLDPTDPPWGNLADFLDLQSSRESSASKPDAGGSRLDWDGGSANDSRSAIKELVRSSSSGSTRRSKSPTTRISDQDSGARSRTHERKSDDDQSCDDDTPQSNPAHHPQDHETQSDVSGSSHTHSPLHQYTSFDEHSAFMEEDTFLDILGLTSGESSAEFQDRDRYEIWASSEAYK